MRLRLTLIDRRSPAARTPMEILVEAPLDATFGLLRSQLLGLLPGDGGDGDLDEVHFEIGGRPLADGHLLGTPPLTRGAAVVARSHPSRMPSASVGLVDLSVVGGPGAGRTLSLGRGEHVVGRSASCSVRLDDPQVSRAHCLLTVGDGEVTVRDLQPANPSRLGDERLPPAGIALSPGANLRIGSTTVVLRQRAMQSVPHRIREGRVLVHVRPRFSSRVAPVEIHFPEEPTRPDSHRLPLLASLAPLVLSGALALALNSPVMLLFALMSPVLLLGQWWSDRRHGRVSHRRTMERHREALVVAGDRLRGALAIETEQRRTEHPDLCLVLELVQRRGPRLWERRADDDDWFVLRVGAATQPSHLKRTGAPTGGHPTVSQVPVVIDLRETPVLGITGSRPRALAVAGCLVAQLAAWHSPRRTRIVLLTGSSASSSDWAWAGLIPHLLSEQGDEVDLRGEYP